MSASPIATAKSSHAVVRTVACCLPVMKPGMPLPAGAKLFGRLPPNGAPLVDAYLTEAVTTTKDPATDLNDMDREPESSGKTIISSFKAGDPRTRSLMCRYGQANNDLMAQAILLIPMPDRARGQCRFDNASFPHTMVCTGR